MLMAYLLTTHRISHTMTAYQLLRNSLNFLGKKMGSLQHCVLLDYMDNMMQLTHLSSYPAATTDLTVNGISLARDPDSTAVSGPPNIQSSKPIKSQLFLILLIQL